MINHQMKIFGENNKKMFKNCLINRVSRQKKNSQKYIWKKKPHKLPQ